MKKVNILMVCGAGLGSSFACQMSVEDVLKEYRLDISLDHSDISSAVSMCPDIIMTAENFKTQFQKYHIDEEKIKIVYLKNIVSKKEIAEKLLPVLKDIGAL